MSETPAAAEVELFCSFCGKSQHVVPKLIAGPKAIMICNECVLLCLHVLRESGLDPSAPTPILRLSLAELEARLIGFLTRHGRSRKLSLGMIGELFYALDLEFDFKLTPRAPSTPPALIERGD